LLPTNAYGTGGSGANEWVALTDLEVSGTDVFLIYVDNGVAGDSFSGNITVIELSA